MKNCLQTNVTGMTSNTSTLKLNVEDLYIGNKRVLNLVYSVKLVPRHDIVSDRVIERFALKLYMNDELIAKENMEVNLSDGLDKTFEKDLEINNTQPENRLFKLELTDIVNGRIEYSVIREMITVMSDKEPSRQLKLFYNRTGGIHKFSFYKETPDERVYMKINNESWKEVDENFSILNKDLIGDVNYIQIYSTDKENNKIYSNVVRFVKN